MLKIKEAIVVEGRYDKNTLSQLVDGVILETGGFGIARDRADLYACGLAGGAGSREKRQRLLEKLDLPTHLTPNAMLPVLSALYDRQTLLDEMEKL